MKNKQIIESNFLSRNKLLAVGFLFLVLGLLIYSNTWHAEFQLDDDAHIKSNLSLRGTLDIPKIWASNLKTRFLSFVTFALNFQMGQDDVVGYHFVNVGIHILNAFWVFLLSILLLKAPPMNGIYPLKIMPILGIFAALIFLTHPLQTQAVTYVVQRMASLAAFFYLGAVVLYIKFRLDSSKACYAGALGMTFAAMFCKENVVTLPLAIVMIDLIFFAQKGGKGKALLCWVPFFAVTLAAFYFSGAALGIFHLFDLKKEGVAVKGILPVDLDKDVLSRGKYLLTQFNVLCTYLRLLIFPVNQNLDYDYPIAKTLFEVKTMTSLLFLTGLLGAAILWIKKNRLLSFGVFWFFLTLSVESSLIPIKDVIVEHRMYLPMAGCSLFLCLGLYEALKDLKQWVVVMVILVSVLSFLAYVRNEVWKTRVGMWEDVVRKSNKKARPYNNLGDGYSRLGMEKKAAEYFQRAIEIDPNYAAAYFNLGHSWGLLGDWGKEKEYYQKAIEKDPKYWSPYLNLGVLLGEEGDLKGALEKFQTVIRGAPANVMAYDNLGVTYSRLGDFEKAVQSFQKAIQVNPYYPLAYFHLGKLRAEQGDFQTAISEFKKAIQENPRYGEAWLELGKTYIAINDFEQVSWVGERLLEISQEELAKQLLKMAEEGTSSIKKPSEKEGPFLKKISMKCSEGDSDCQKGDEMTPEEKEVYESIKTVKLVQSVQRISEQRRTINVVKAAGARQVVYAQAPAHVLSAAFQRVPAHGEIQEK